jgi:hypothetical protein
MAGKFNYGGLALAIVGGVLGAVGATLHAGTMNGPALSGAALAGAVSGAGAFFIHPKHADDGTVLTPGQQLNQGLLTAAGIAGTILPAQAQPAAARVLEQVAAGASGVPASANVTATGVDPNDLATTVATVLAVLQQARQPQSTPLAAPPSSATPQG